jgi:hypothetical protein
MATRYCGFLRIEVVYQDATTTRPDRYRCVIKCLSEDNPIDATVYVGTPRYNKLALDSAEAIDNAAHAALSFADNDGWPIPEYAEDSACGWVITRNQTHVAKVLNLDE